MNPKAISRGYLPAFNSSIGVRGLWFLLLVSLLASCSPERELNGEVLYRTYCTSCHLAPEIKDLPGYLWEQQVLPEMGARLGIRENGYSPYDGMSMEEQYSIIQSGVYPSKPLIDPEDWDLLKAYIISGAPDTLPATELKKPVKELTQFLPHPLSLDSIPGTLITFMGLGENASELITGEVSGKLATYNFKTGESVSLGRFGKAITSCSTSNGTMYVTSAGYLDPSEIASGRIFGEVKGTVTAIPDILHRPVHTTVHDFNGDGVDELVVCEFGDLNGALSLLVRKQNGKYEKRTLLQQPGAIRTLVKDMNADGMDDLLVLTSQGDEGVTVMYQEENLSFRPEKILRFSPVYGTSWFEVFDYEGDGDLDIVTVHGDNADKTFIPKPYHGMRLHINDGHGHFEEAFFFPFNGATRVIASDFDKDGDIDFNILSTFPRYDQKPIQSFVYLENLNELSYDFQPYSLDISALGHWFLMDSGDIDGDGDEDLLLSSFTYFFTAVPEALKETWNASGTDILILENQYKPETQ